MIRSCRDEEKPYQKELTMEIREAIEATSEAVDRYINEIAQHPLIDYKREKQLAKIIRKFKDGKQKQAAREELMNSNLRLVVKIAYKYKNFFDIPMMDLISAGNVGLAKSIDLYNPRKFNTRFTTWAYPIIRQSIFRLLYMFSNPVRIPLHIVDQSRQYKKILEKYADVSDEELMESLEVSEAGLNKIRMANTKTVYLDKEIFDGESDTLITLGQILPDVSTTASNLNMGEFDRKEHLHAALDTLGAIDKDIIVGLFFDEETLKSVGKRHGITAEAVRLRKLKALKKMQYHLKKTIKVRN